jgi:hypothetical protein
MGSTLPAVGGDGHDAKVSIVFRLRHLEPGLTGAGTDADPIPGADAG